MTSKFTVKKGPTQWQAKVFSGDGQEVAKIRKAEEQPEFRLIKGNREWVLTNRVDGEHRRFSFSVIEPERQEVVLTVQDNVFRHNGKFYMLANNPEGRSWRSYVSSPVRYISRLDNFPYSDASEMQENRHHQSLRHKLKRFRGVPVGETSGLGATAEGHRVRVDDELDDIGLFIAAASYLMYASA